MSTASRATERLLRIRDRMKAGESLDAEDAGYFAAALEQWLGGADLTAAFGVKPSAGQADPRRIIAEIRRDELIRVASERFLGHVPCSRRAGELHRAWVRHRERASRNGCRGASGHPRGLPGSLEELLRRITALRPRVLSERHIRRILAKGSPHFVARETCSQFRKQETVQEEGTLHGT